MTSFDDFWKLYPRHDAKKDARKAWDKLKPSPALAQTMCEAVVKQTAWRKGMVARLQWVAHWPYPATWIRGERWNDETPGLTVTRRTVLTYNGDEERDLV